MNVPAESRRQFLKSIGLGAGAFVLSAQHPLAQTALATLRNDTFSPLNESDPADYTLHIQASPLEIAPKRIISATTYNGQFPGPLLRFKEGQPVTVDIFNDTDTPEQLHWHGQKVSTDVDGAAEEGTPLHSRPRQTPNHVHAESRRFSLLSHAQPGRRKPGRRTVQRPGRPGLHRAETRPRPLRPRSVSRAEGIRAHLQPGRRYGPGFSFALCAKQALEETGESAMKASLAKGMPHGYEVGYNSFTINGRMLGHGEPIRVKQGQRVLFHILNGSATEIRSLALPGHTFQVVALDGNPVPNPARRSGALARHRRTHLRHRGNESSRRLDHGRSRRRRPPPRHGHRRRVRRPQGQSAMDRASALSAGTMRVSRSPARTPRRPTKHST